MTNVLLAEAHDLPELITLFQEYLAFYDRKIPALEAGRFLSDRLALGESVIFIARDGQHRAQGFAQMYPSFSSLGLCRTWILNDLFVHRAARGMGLGRAMLERCHRHARETGAAAVTLETAETNAGAQRLYESLGYTRATGFVGYSRAVQPRPAHQ